MSDATHTAEKQRLTRKSWVQTFTGKKFTPLDPRPEDVCIEDIAHALSQKVRFTGHTNWLYTVGQHSLYVSSILPPRLKLAGLLHDATEAYLPDIAAPIKGFVHLTTPRGVVPFREFEDYLADVIFAGLGLSSLRPLIDSEEMKRADLVMLATEVRDVMGPAPDDWGLAHMPAWGSIELEPSPAQVKSKFLEEYHRLRAA